VVTCRDIRSHHPGFQIITLIGLRTVGLILKRITEKDFGLFGKLIFLHAFEVSFFLASKN